MEIHDRSARVSRCPPCLSCFNNAPSIALASEKDPHTPVSPDGIGVRYKPLHIPNQIPGTLPQKPPPAGTEIFNEDDDDLGFPEIPLGEDDASPLVIIGDDDRILQDPTYLPPPSTVAQIRFTKPNGTPGRCTGFLYSPSSLATAGHCVYSNQEEDGTLVQGWNSNFRVYPARNGSSLPFYHCNSGRPLSVTGWTQDANPLFDYGVIQLDECGVDPPGIYAGTMGLLVHEFSLDWVTATIIGYPAEAEPANTQWWHSGQIIESQSRQLLYEIDTTPGQSGSPVYVTLNSMHQCQNWCALAIHTWGPYGAYELNRGTRITEPVLANYINWYA